MVHAQHPLAPTDVERMPPQDQSAPEWPDRSPLSAEERERGLRIVAELRRLHAEMLAERNGRPFEPAVAVLHEQRDERGRQLG